MENREVEKLKYEEVSSEEENTALRYARKFRIIAVGYLIFVLICCLCVKYIKSDAPDSVKSVAASTDITSDAEDELTIDDAVTDELSDVSTPTEPDESQAEVVPPDDLSELKSQIDTALENYRGTWSVYVKNLNTGNSVSINNHQVYAASEIKLFALAAAYQQISEGTLSEDKLYDTMYSMITDSSNECFNSIVRYVGLYYITDWCQKNGYDDTIQCHGLYPASNADGLSTMYGYNMTTVEDIGDLLESIYKGECISEEYSQKMLDIMLEQNILDKIPAGLPKNVKVANKTGETESYNHDAAIVFSDSADYILTVMISYPDSAWSCNDSIAELSGLVYGYFNK